MESDTKKLIADMGKKQMAKYGKVALILFVLACIACIAVPVALKISKKDDESEGATAPGATGGPKRRTAARNTVPESSHDDGMLSTHAARGAKTATTTMGTLWNTGLSQGELGPLTQVPIAPDKPAAQLVVKPVPQVFKPAASPVFTPAAPLVAPSKGTASSPFVPSPLLPGPSQSVLIPNRKVSRYIFTDGTRNHRASWETHIMHQHMRYHPGTLIWDIGEAAEDRGVIIGRTVYGGRPPNRPHWLIWREKHAKSFKSLHYWQNSASEWYMAAIYMLWGTNRISTDDQPSEENGWTPIGLFRVGKVGPRGVKGKDQQVGAYVAPQMKENREEMNDGTETNPLTQKAFGIWGITPVYLFQERGHGVFISRLSINEPADRSLNDFETTVLPPGQTLEYV